MPAVPGDWDPDLQRVRLAWGRGRTDDHAGAVRSVLGDGRGLSYRRFEAMESEVQALRRRIGELEAGAGASSPRPAHCCPDFGYGFVYPEDPEAAWCTCSPERHALPHIVAVAIRANGLTISAPRPARHSHVLHALPTQLACSAEQGFLTDGGQFVDRVEALAIARNAGQLLRPASLPELYSEDLW